MAAALKMRTRLREADIIEANGDDVLPKRAHRISSSLSAEQKTLNLNCSNPILGHSDSVLCAKFSQADPCLHQVKMPHCAFGTSSAPKIH